MSPRSRVTLSEIAEQSGVSLSTVSLVLRDKPGVGTVTRQRVLGIAKELGYFPKNGIQHRPSLTNIGLILKSEPGRTPQANQFYSHVLAGIEMACRQWQFNLLYATLPVDRDSYPLELPRVLLEEDTADGLLLIGAFLDNTIARVVERRSTPIVLVDAYAASDLHDAVVSDNFKGACYAVTYLTQRGHRHIGFVGSHPHAYPSIQERQRGYVQALQDNEIPDSYFADCHIIDREEILDATADLLRQNPQITALFATNDEVAIVAMEAVQALGRRIPGDVSIIGFDDIDPAKSTSPSLTTMHVDKIGMGMLAVQLLVNRVEYPESNPVTTVIHPHLVERQSVQSI
ncbi:MAG: LacI family DNA-binding transcriptional regulator [Anaerolineae bacterium]|jgi:LacI family transcriptional regulator|nr:LacI family DNA-binding transcriptional regulator [Anaerolineae bacterium]